MVLWLPGGLLDRVTLPLNQVQVSYFFGSVPLLGIFLRLRMFSTSYCSSSTLSLSITSLLSVPHRPITSLFWPYLYVAPSSRKQHLVTVIIMSGFHPILIEPAKSSRGQCKQCKRVIQKDSLRLQVADDRQFNEYIRMNGGRSVFHGEGMSRGGYIETEEGVISIKRYFVHLDCYRPIRLHPFTPDHFRLQNCQSRHKASFSTWLTAKNAHLPSIQPRGQKRRGKRNAAKDDEYVDMSEKKNKKIQKRKK